MAHKVTLNWDPAPTTGPVVTSWDVKRGPSATGPFTQIANVPTNSYVDSSPEVQVEGATFFYEVTAVDAAGESQPSVVVSAHIPFSVPGAPTNLVATVD